MQLHGGNLIAGEISKAGARTFRGVDAASGAELEPAFHEATEDEIDRALNAAAAAFPEYRRRTPEKIA